MFRSEAHYLVHKKDPILWKQVLNEDNLYRQPLLDQVIQIALPETNDFQEISITVKALMMTNLSNEQLQSLKKIAHNNSIFNEH